MIKLKCIIADDEPLALNLLKGYVTQTPFLDLVQACNSAVKVLELLENHSVDLLFLDIQMPNLTGMQLAKSLGENGPPVIFTTAFEEYALEGYKVNAIDYLLKPFNYEEFLTAAQKAKKRQSIQPKVEEDYIIVKSDYKLRQIALDDILYIEGLKDYVKIYQHSTGKFVMSLISLKAMEQHLPEHQFMRIHRSFIVNLNAIDMIERGMIVFGDKRIVISDKYKPAFQAFLDRRSL